MEQKPKLGISRLWYKSYNCRYLRELLSIKYKIGNELSRLSTLDKKIKFLFFLFAYVRNIHGENKHERNYIKSTQVRCPCQLVLEP